VAEKAEEDLDIAFITLVAENGQAC